ncbi:MAG: HD domain-containing protein [Syntrophomonadaceae bacterium]|nr:HD domain-containing protein [Syntrophomonadaceae bacterium]
MEPARINLYEMLLCITNSVDLVAPQLANHHQQVAFLAYHLAKAMGLPKAEQQQIIIEGMLHDIGALDVAERLAVIEEEPITVNGHAFRGAKLLEYFDPFRSIAEAVRYHHIKWQDVDDGKFKGIHIPLASHILYLADRTCVLINKNNEVLPQIPEIMSNILSKKGSHFMPKAVEAMESLSPIEHIWLALAGKTPINYLPSEILNMTDLDLDNLIELARMFSRIIDFRSHFTATHSAGVAKTAEKLGELCGFSSNECKMILIAGYLHDLGKLAIDNTLLEKPAALTEKEFDIIRSHTFFTYELLNVSDSITTIKKWASFHHEKLNGQGYPFHLTGEDIPLGARIMAVADIFTAVTENRPYRPGMEKEKVIGVLESMVNDGSICSNVVSILKNNFDLLTEICKAHQQIAERDYKDFLASANPGYIN